MPSLMWSAWWAIGLALIVAWRSGLWEEAFYDASTLKGKRAIVVGASSGIGREMVLYLASHGAQVVAVARRKSDLESLAAQAPQYITALAADAAVTDDIGKIVEVASQGCDYLFLNHAVFPERNWAKEPDMAVMRKTFDINFFSYIDLTTRFLPILSRSKGSITVTSSVAGISGVPLQGIYSAGKHALHGFFDSLRHDLTLAKMDVSVTVAVVGSIDVDRRADSALAGTDSYYGKIPLWTSDAAATRIVMGAVLRQREVDVPKSEVGQVRVMKVAMPSLIDGTMIKIASSHACTKYGPYVSMILCPLPF